MSGTLEIDRYTAARRWVSIFAALKLAAPDYYSIFWDAVPAFQRAYNGQHGDGPLLHIFISSAVANSEGIVCPTYMRPLARKIVEIADQLRFPATAQGFSQAATAQIWFINNFVWTDDMRWLPYGEAVGVLEPEDEAEGIRSETEQWLYGSMNIASINHEIARKPRRPEYPIFIPGQPREDYLALVTSLAESLMADVEDEALTSIYGYEEPTTKRTPDHYRWLVQYQCLGLSHSEIAYDHLERTDKEKSDDAISKALRRTSALLGLVLRPTAIGGRRSS